MVPEKNQESRSSNFFIHCGISVAFRRYVNIITDLLVQVNESLGLFHGHLVPGTYPWRFACDASSLVSIRFAVSLLWVCMTKHSRDDAVNGLSSYA